MITPTYAAGPLTVNSDGLHTLTMNLLRSRWNAVESTLFCRFLEVWCADHCEDDWRIEKDGRELQIHLSSDYDMVMFKLSEDYDIFNSRKF